MKENGKNFFPQVKKMKEVKENSLSLLAFLGFGAA